MDDTRKTRRRGVRTDPDIAEAVRELAQSGQDWTAAGIRRRVLEDHPEWAPRMPGERTIQNLVRGLLGQAGDPWSFSTTDHPEDAGLVLRVLGELWDTGVWPRALTVDEAEYIVRLRRAVPDLPAIRALALARAYLMAADGSNIYTAAGLDRYLAFAPWRDGAARYVKAFTENRITEYFGMPGDPTDQEVRAILRGPTQSLEERAKRITAARNAGANPFLDGRPYRPEDKP
jgi:hypothetical protein